MAPNALALTFWTLLREAVSSMKLARLKKGQFYIPIYVPSFLLKLVLGEMSIEVLKSATISCDKIHAAGFTFLYPSIDAALQNLVIESQTK